MADILPPPYRRLIEALAQAIARDYLRQISSNDNNLGNARTNHASLPPTEKAA